MVKEVVYRKDLKGKLGAICPQLGTPTPFTGTLHLHPQFRPAPEGGPIVHAGHFSPQSVHMLANCGPLAPSDPRGVLSSARL